MDETQLTAWRAAFRAQLQEARRRFRPDIVICHHLWLLARLVLDVFGDIPVIGISHGTDIRQARQNPAMCAREVGSLRRLARVLALSEHHLDELCACFDLQPEQIVVTGGAIDTSRFFPDGARRARGPAEPVRLVYAGKMARAKGTYELIEAFGLARAADPHLSLDLIGRIPPALAAHIEAVGGTAAPIRIFDLESQAHFAEHLRRLDVFVFPSYFEGLGLVALEALASGLSLVANRLPPLLGQLGPRLSADPAVAWVDLPRLHGVDKIDPSERGAYIDRLAAAILRQAAYSRDPAAVSAHPYRELADHSWQRLSRRVLDLADQLMD